jgi:hypothetical protein
MRLAPLPLSKALEEMPIGRSLVHLPVLLLQQVQLPELRLLALLGMLLEKIGLLRQPLVLQASGVRQQLVQLSNGKSIAEH